ncbi:protein TolR [Granulosicoccaceae sp. 1_MG-2023]|nr:protein TolR [Granulosicoccaceae sp. 1_MG-2023]
MSAMPQRRTRRQVAEMNVVPYIDVMLVLLVIFMITAPLLNTGVEIDLPDAEAKPVESEQNEEPLILSVTAAGEFYLNVGEDPEAAIDEQTVQRLAAAVIRLNPDRSVLVAGDKDVAYGQIWRGMDLLREAGASKIQLMAEPPQ